MSKKIEINLHDFHEEFQKVYADLYDNWQPADYRDCARAFDRFLEEENHARFAGEFARHRGTFITSDREAAAFMMALAKLDSPEETDEPDLPIPVPRTVISFTTVGGGADVAMFDTDDTAELLELFHQHLLEHNLTLISVNGVSH